jgi:release factor glutamine methyltransferase
MWGEIRKNILKELGFVYKEEEAQLLSKYLLSDLFHDDFSKYDSNILDNAIERLKKYEPLQYVTGKAYFFEYVFNVNAHVLIPRPETEELVGLSIDIIKKKGFKSILDIGTGSGCIAISIKKKLPDVKVYASDISEEAIKVALSNSTKLKVEIEFIQNDILNENTWQTMPKVDMIVSNPPYIGIEESNSILPNVLNYEPHLALFSSDEPLKFYEKISKFGLANSSQIAFEINEKYGKETQEIIKKNGYKNVSLIKDLQNKDRFCMATV